MSNSFKNVLGPIMIIFLYGVFFYFCASFLWKNGLIIALREVNSQNVELKLLTDFTMNMLIVVLISGFMLLKRVPLKEIGIVFQSRLICLILLAVYGGIFFRHGDFTIKGCYTAFFYLVIVAFSEEFIFRGFLFSIVEREYGIWIGIIISGLLFGGMHGLLPTIIAGGHMADLLRNILSNLLGQGVLGGAVFVLAYKKSGTLFVPILIHAILNYL